MLITVTTSSQSLNAILSAGQLTNVNENTNGVFRGVLQNLGSQDIYLEWRSAATTTDGIKVVQNNTYTFETPTLGDLNLIANSSSNTNVRVSFN